jgi:hypothetical protein
MPQITVNLESELVEDIKKLIIELASCGKIRSTDDGRYSVIDVIRNATDRKAPRSAWSRIKHYYVNGCTVVDFCNYHYFSDAGNRETPVASLEGCIYIISLMPGEMGQKMRCLSARVMGQVVRQTSEQESPVIPTPDASTSQMFALMQSQNQQMMAAMMQIQQESNRQIQSVLNALTQVVVNASSRVSQSEAVKDSVDNPTHHQLIDDVIAEQVDCNYKKMWVRHSLVNHSLASSFTLNDWLYCAMKLGYKPGWACHRYNETRYGKKTS